MIACKDFPVFRFPPGARRIIIAFAENRATGYRSAFVGLLILLSAGSVRLVRFVRSGFRRFRFPPSRQFVGNMINQKNLKNLKKKIKKNILKK